MKLQLFGVRVRVRVEEGRGSQELNCGESCIDYSLYAKYCLSISIWYKVLRFLAPVERPRNWPSGKFGLIGGLMLIHLLSLIILNIGLQLRISISLHQSLIKMFFVFHILCHFYSISSYKYVKNMQTHSVKKVRKLALIR